MAPTSLQTELTALMWHHAPRKISRSAPAVLRPKCLATKFDDAVPLRTHTPDCSAMASWRLAYVATLHV